jgi:hypothetical protein
MFPFMRFYLRVLVDLNEIIRQLKQKVILIKVIFAWYHSALFPAIEIKKVCVHGKFFLVSLWCLRVWSFQRLSSDGIPAPSAFSRKKACGSRGLSHCLAIEMTKPLRQYRSTRKHFPLTHKKGGSEKMKGSGIFFVRKCLCLRKTQAKNDARL